MTNNPAYMSLYRDLVKQPLDRSFSVSSTKFQDYHEYEVIPATLPDHDIHVHKSVDGSPLVSDPAVKIDSVPQN